MSTAKESSKIEFKRQSSLSLVHSWAPTQDEKWGGGAREVSTIITKDFKKALLFCKKVGGTRPPGPDILIQVSSYQKYFRLVLLF